MQQIKQLATDLTLALYGFYRFFNRATILPYLFGFAHHVTVSGRTRLTGLMNHKAPTRIPGS